MTASDYNRLESRERYERDGERKILDPRTKPFGTGLRRINGMRFAGFTLGRKFVEFCLIFEVELVIMMFVWGFGCGNSGKL